MTFMHITVFGDSHVNALRTASRDFVESKALEIFVRPDYDCVVPPHRVRIRAYPSATAASLAKHHSRTGTGLAIRQSMKSDCDEGCDLLCLCFGKVDLDFVWPYIKLANRSPLSIDEFIDRTLLQYSEFAKALCQDAALSATQLVLMALPLPVNEANEMAQAVLSESIAKHIEANNVDVFESGSRKAEIDLQEVVRTVGTLAERTIILRRFNAKLQSYARANGFGFLAIDSIMLDKSSQVVAERFRWFSEHHARRETLGPPWMAHLISSYCL